MLAIALLAHMFAAPAGPVHGDGDDLAKARDDWATLDREIAQIGAVSAAGGIDITAFMKLSYGYSDETALLNGDTVSRLSIDDVHVMLDGELDDWLIHIGLRGEANSGQSFFGDAGTVGNVRAFEVVLSREVHEDWFVRLGQFRAPFLGSALHEDNELLFVNRTYNGEKWDFFDMGATVEGKLSVLRGWASIQNGIDKQGNDFAFTGRGMIDVLGEGAGYEHEGAFGAPPGPQLSLGAAAYYDQSTTNASSQSLEGNFTFNRVSAAAELVDNGNGLGSLYSWGATASFLVLDTLELAARYESFERADDTNLWRFAVDKYIEGHAVKLQAEFDIADSHAPRANVKFFQVGFVVSL